MEMPWLSLYPKSVPHNISFDGHSSISEAIESAFIKFSRSPAATCMGTTMTYGEMKRMADRFASFLQNSLGINKGDRIAIMLPNIIQFPLAELAALKIGAVCVNTNPMYTPREMKHQFKDSGAVAIVIIDMFLNKLEEIISETDIKHVIVTSIGDQLPLWKAIPFKFAMQRKKLIPSHKLKTINFRQAVRKGDASKLLPLDLSLSDLAVLQYTGGTTGLSKGAMLTHGNILANMLQIRYLLKDQLDDGHETVLTALPLYHIFALTVNFLTLFMSGQHLVLIPKPVPIDNTVDAFKKYPVSFMTGVNTLFNSLNHSSSFKLLAPKTLKFALAGGMALQEHVNKTFQQITGVRIIEGFGLTEASPVTHVNPVKGDNPVGSIGIPLPSTEAMVVDDSGQPTKPGEPGELIIRGPQVMKGYWNQPAESSKVLRNGWLWTGDMAKMNEQGYFFIVDRKKDMILVSGFNVYPNEIEEVLSSHPKVLESAVIGIADSSSGEAVKAFVVAKDKSLTTEELRDFCRKNLTGYKVPRQVVFVESLPKSNIGKILRKNLRDTPTA